MNDDGWEEILSVLKIIGDQLDELALQDVEEFVRCVATLSLIEQRSEVLFRAERLCAGTADEGRFTGAIQANMGAELALRRRIREFEKLMEERDSATVH